MVLPSQKAIVQFVNGLEAMADDCSLAGQVLQTTMGDGAR